MFQLKQEIDRWCQSIFTTKSDNGEFVNSEFVEELTDHLFCEVDRLKGKGISEKEAFAEAAAQFGDLSKLKSEYTKNKQFNKKSCLQKRNGRLLIGISLFFAALMILSSLIWPDLASSQTINFLLIALWSVPFFYLSGGDKQAGKEIAYLKRKWQRFTKVAE